MIEAKKKKRFWIGSFIIIGYIGLFVLGKWINDTYGVKSAIALFGAILVGNVTYSVLYFINEFRYDQMLVGRLDLETSVQLQSRRRFLTWYWMFLVNTSQLFVFAFLFQYFYKLGGDKYFTYIRPLTYVDWVLYTLDCTFKSIFDIPEIFNLHLRNIKHVGLAGGAIVVLIRTLIYTMLATALVRRVKKWMQLQETLHALNVTPDVAGRRFLRMGEEALPGLDQAMTKPEAFCAEVNPQETLKRDEHTEPIIQLLLRNLRVGDQAERRNAAVLFGLFAIQDTSAHPYLYELLQHARQEPNPDIRMEVIRSLGKIGDRRLLVSIRSFLRSPHEQVRASAARVLGKMKDINAIHILSELLKDTDSNVRLSAARALGQIGSQRALPFLQDSLAHKDPQVRKEIVFSLTHLKDKKMTPQLVEMLEDENPKLRLKAVHFLWELRSASVSESLVKHLNDPSPEVRLAVTRTLADIAPKAALEKILSDKKEPESHIRRAQVSLILGCKEERCLPYLGEATKDDDPLVREQALQVLGAYETEDAATLLLQALKNADSIEDQINATRALGLCKQEMAYEALLPLAQKSKNPQLERQAILSLGWLDPKRAKADLAKETKES